MEEMKQEINIEQPSTNSFPIPVEVKVEAQESGFLIKVITEETCRGLLVFILEAFEELGLDVLQARVSCSHNFHLEALGIIDNKGSSNKDTQTIEQAMFQAIQRWTEISKSE